MALRLRFFLAALASLALVSCGGSRWIGAPGGQSPAGRLVHPQAYQQNNGAQFVEFNAACAVPLGQVSHGASTASMWFSVPAGCAKKAPGFVEKIEILTGQVTEYKLGTASEPLAIAANAGYVWVADQHKTKTGTRLIYQFQESGSSTSFALPSAIEVASLVAGPDGNLWFCGSYTSKKKTVAGYGYVTPTGSSKLYELSGTPTPILTSIAAGSDGNIYITDENGSIDQVAPSTGAATTFAVGGHPFAITNSSNVMVYSDASVGQLSTITKTGQFTVYPAPSGERPGFLARKSDGTVLYIDTANNSDALGTFNPSGGTYEGEVQAPNAGLRYLYNGPDGNMWFTDALGHIGAYLKFILTTSPTSLSISAPSCSAKFTPSETNFSGDFSVASKDVGIATVSPATGAAGTSFTVTGVGDGSTTILVQDSMQNATSVAVSVTGPCGGNGEMVYISDNSQILIYDAQSGEQVGSISYAIDGPTGLDIDPQGDLYVANSDAQNGLLFPAGQSKPTVTFQNPGTYPWDIARCLDGTVYVAPLFANLVSIYANGSSTPTGTISNSDSTGNFAVHCDSSSNVYVLYQSSQYDTARVREYPPGGTGSGTLLKVQGGYRSSITLDQAGDVVLANTAANDIEFWAPGATQPYKTFTTLQDDGVLQYVKFDAAESLLWVQVASGSGTIAYALSSYSGGIVLQLPLVTAGGPGLAISPADSFSIDRGGQRNGRPAHVHWNPPTTYRPQPAPTTFRPLNGGSM